MFGEMGQISRHEASSLGRVTSFLVHAQGTRTATLLLATTCAGHVALGFVEFCGRERVPAEALTSILSSCKAEAASGTEGNAGFVGDMIAVEVAPLRKRSGRDSVDKAAGVDEAGGGRRWC